MTINSMWLPVLIALGILCTQTKAQKTPEVDMASVQIEEKSKPASDSDQRIGNWNWTAPTMGGKQFWTDQFVYGEWRIQQNVYSKHCRLLDPKNFRRAWGTFNECRRKFESLKSAEDIPKLSGKAMVLLHGLGRSRGSMSKLAEHYRGKGFVPINVEYASTRGSIKDHAHALNRIIGQLEGVDEIYFIGHSMGNIVWRYYLHEFTNEKTGVQGDPRIRTTVMIAPPNNGAYFARVLRPTGIFGVVAGQSGKELGSKDWSKFAEELATPQHRFGIVAGKYNNVNPLFRVDNDTTVSVDETKLVGARDFEVVDCMHATIMANKKVIAFTDKFIESGYFVAEDQRTPLR